MSTRGIGRSFSFVATIALAIVAGGWAGWAAVGAEPAKSAVVIDNYTFGPATLTVPHGTTVTWINKDDDPHTVVSDGDPKLFKSSALDTDQSFTFTFSEAGTFKYFCTIHPRMQGTVVVQ